MSQIVNSDGGAPRHYGLVVGSLDWFAIPCLLLGLLGKPSPATDS
jgi:hypothetical protein